jgi:hypothetical protein
MSSRSTLMDGTFTQSPDNIVALTSDDESTQYRSDIGDCSGLTFLQCVKMTT